MSVKCRPLSTEEMWEMMCRSNGWDPYPHGKNPDGSPVIGDEMVDATRQMSAMVRSMKKSGEEV